ncbi:hypothetical protein [Scytonema hofmannii]|uniref:hypothetical protein n=1 Tax=Scytonema hofmannii TaxID=34078 RepID=UPI0003448C9C|nr:hypothetical protein [Scytonema hofmannii]
MPTQKFQPKEGEAYDKSPVQFKVKKGVREKLKTIPNWQDILRTFVDDLISDAPKNDP